MSKWERGTIVSILNLITSRSNLNALTQTSFCASVLKEGEKRGERGRSGKEEGGEKRERERWGGG